MAIKVEEYGMLRRSMDDYPVEVAEQALRVLESDALPRSEGHIEAAKWFLDVSRRARDARAKLKGDNAVWYTVARAPAGWCHVRSGVLGTLMDDIKAGADFETVRRRWASKMHPLQYRRPTAVAAGAIEAAERKVKELGIERSLERRYATLPEVLAAGAVTWTPENTQPSSPGAGGGHLFGHLRPTKGAVPAVAGQIPLPPATMTWKVFERDVLPRAGTLEVYLPPSPMPFYGLVTAVHPDAPPILKWDGIKLPGESVCRNPFSWYLYTEGSRPEAWGLSPGQWATVKAVFPAPPVWGLATGSGLFREYADRVFLALDGCHDKGGSRKGSFFPEMFRAELHPIRAVLEAHARSVTLPDPETGTANGIDLCKDAGTVYRLRVKERGGEGTREYRIDRWE
jgi:hypothetical protein